MVVVVVPALAEREQREQRVVSRVVPGRVASRAAQVGQRVDRKRQVPEEDRGGEGAPDRRRDAAEQQQRSQHHQRRDEVVAIEPAELRIAGEIADQLVIGLLEPLRENPPDVAPEEAALTRRVEVGGLVGVSVVVPMVAGPPESASLCAGSAEEGEDELEAPPGLEAPVREVAMEASGE